MKFVQLFLIACLGFFLFAIGCTAAQQAAIQRDATAVQNATTQPAVVAAVKIADPFAANLPSLILGAVGTLAGIVATKHLSNLKTAINTSVDTIQAVADAIHKHAEAVSNSTPTPALPVVTAK